MKEFEIDARIVADCHYLGKWRDFHLMLHRDSSVRWLIIVPETDASEWHELPADVRDELIRLTSPLGAVLRKELKCDKVNIAAIGNIVSQFHLHVIGRWKNDPYWPGVVWGRSSIGAEYPEEEIGNLRRRCFDAFEGASRI